MTSQSPQKKWLVILVCSLIMGFGSQAHAVKYELPDLNGKIQSLDQYLGKWVIVNYWATWCSTCLKELPDLGALHSKYKDGDIVVIGINFESINPDRLKQFVTEQSIPYPIWRSNVVLTTPLGQIPALPATYIVDPKGEVVAGQLGMVTQNDLEGYIAGKRPSYQEAPQQGNRE